MTEPSRRLTLLKKFERQVAPLERYHIDYLGLCEDTRLEIANLEKTLKRKQKGSIDATPTIASHEFAWYEAAVGDEEAFGSEKGDGSKRAEKFSLEREAKEQEPKGGSLHGGGGEEFSRAKARSRRARSLQDSGSSSRWYHVFSRSRRRGDHPAPPPPTPSPFSVSSPNQLRHAPLKSDQEDGYRKPTGPARVESEYPPTLALESNDAPYLHPDQRGSGEYVPHTRLEAMGRK